MEELFHVAVGFIVGFAFALILVSWVDEVKR